jgi:hypothetical protein
MQIEVNPRVSKFQPDKQTNKQFHTNICISVRAERPSDCYRVFLEQSTIIQDTKYPQLLWRVHGNEPTPLSRALLHKLTVPQLVNKFPTFMQPEGSLSNSQQPAACPCAEQQYFMSRPAIQFLKTQFILFSHLHLGFPSSLFSSGFPTKLLHALWNCSCNTRRSKYLYD